jgi:cytochrome c oxidase subunit 2
MSPELGTAQLLVLVIFAVLAVFFGVVLVLVARRAARPVDFEQVRATGYRVRRRWLVFLAFALASSLLASAFFVPYGASGGNFTEARVVGGQFYWSISPDTFRRGERVRFEVRAADVNHGFGIYDPSGVMIGSVQAMPGYANRLTLTLEKAGRYTIACLEYCGLEHHKMIREFEVLP